MITIWRDSYVKKIHPGLESHSCDPLALWEIAPLLVAELSYFFLIKTTFFTYLTRLFILWLSWKPLSLLQSGKGLISCQQLTWWFSLSFK